MRRILLKVGDVDREMESFGDTSTLADPSIVKTIVESAPEM